MRKRKWMSMLLALVMVISIVTNGLTAYADEYSQDTTEEVVTYTETTPDIETTPAVGEDVSPDYEEYIESSMPDTEESDSESNDTYNNDEPENSSSEAVQTVEKLIQELTDTTTASSLAGLLNQGEDEENTESYRDAFTKLENLQTELEDIRQKYDSLSAEEQGQVTNIDKLIELENIIASVSSILAMGLTSETVSSSPREINVILSDFTITSRSSDGVVRQNTGVNVEFKWDATSYGMTLKEGDYFVVNLPDELSLTSASLTASSFSLANENGVVFATAVIDRTNKKVTATFNKNVENKYDVKGTMTFKSNISSATTTAGEDNTFTISSGSSVVAITIPVEAQNPGTEWFTDKIILHKGGSFATWGTSWEPKGSANNVTQAMWAVRINTPADTTYHNVVIKDSLSGGDGGSSESVYIEESFRLYTVSSFNVYGTPQDQSLVDISDKLSISADGRSFTLTLGDITDKYYLTYYTTFDYVEGNSIKNNVTLTATENSTTRSYTQTVASGSGTADARVPNRIKLVKVDADNREITLANAEFEVTGPDNTTFTLTTGEDGTVTSDILKQGTYTVKEITAPTGYELNNETFTADVGDDGVILTIADDPIKTEVSGKKTWIDNGNQDGIRPSSIKINLLANGEVKDSVKVTEAEDWSYTFSDLRKFENGQEINYTITEDVVEAYSTTYDGYNVTNEHTPGKTSVTVTKSWNDNNNQDGVRPNEITVKLLADGEDTGKSLTLNEANNWTGSFTELDEKKNGQNITYTIEEITVNSYTTAITGTQESGYVITNSHTPETIEVTGEKTWNDNDDQDGARPEAITINLVANGNIVKSVTVTEDDDWSYSFTDLPKFENGEEINYSITEEAVADYSTTYDGYNVTNEHTPGKTSVTVTKSWNDNNNQDGVRPNEITVKLLADGKDTGKSLTLNEANNWTSSFTELDEKSKGEDIVYTIEETAVEGYSTVITGTQTSGYVITNSHTPETIEVEGKKTWDDKENKDGLRPEKITINLVANDKVVESKEVTEKDNWNYSFKDLPKYENGEEIKYTIKENEVDGYKTSYDGYNVTNKHTPTNSVLPQTGAIWWPVILLIIIGAAFIAFAFKKGRKK